MANGPLDERQIKEDAQKIYEFYQKHGYNQAQITYTIDRNRSTGYATVVFKVREGPKVKISAVNFVGNDHVKASRLRKEMETKKWNWISWLMDTGRMKDDVFDEDLDKIRDYYKEQGYLDIEIAEDKITFDYPKPDKLVITVRIREGRLYRVGEISFTGNKVYPSALLTLVPKQRKGMWSSPRRNVDKDQETPSRTSTAAPATSRPTRACTSCLQAQPADRQHRRGIRNHRERQIPGRVDQHRG